MVTLQLLKVDVVIVPILKNDREFVQCSMAAGSAKCNQSIAPRFAMILENWTGLNTILWHIEI
jgi:hypothetical protein